ncbi:MAG: hypothetical protein QXX75_05075 [Thermoplasmatales archaeon]
MAKYQITIERAYGTPIPNLKNIAKKISIGNVNLLNSFIDSIVAYL